MVGASVVLTTTSSKKNRALDVALPVNLILMLPVMLVNSTVYSLHCASFSVTVAAPEQLVYDSFKVLASPLHAPDLKVKVAEVTPIPQFILGVSASPIFLLAPNFAAPPAPYGFWVVQPVLSATKAPFPALSEKPAVPVEFLNVSLKTSAPHTCPIPTIRSIVNTIARRLGIAVNWLEIVNCFILYEFWMLISCFSVRCRV